MQLAQAHHEPCVLKTSQDCQIVGGISIKRMHGTIDSPSGHSPLRACHAQKQTCYEVDIHLCSVEGRVFMYRLG
jgi:hypothetical protein